MLSHPNFYNELQEHLPDIFKQDPWLEFLHFYEVALILAGATMAAISIYLLFQCRMRLTGNLRPKEPLAANAKSLVAGVSLLLSGCGLVLWTLVLLNMPASPKWIDRNALFVANSYAALEKAPIAANAMSRWDILLLRQNLQTMEVNLSKINQQLHLVGFTHEQISAVLHQRGEKRLNTAK